MALPRMLSIYINIDRSRVGFRCMEAIKAALRC